MSDLEAAVEQTPAIEIEPQTDLNAELEAIWDKQDEPPAPEVDEDPAPEKAEAEPVAVEKVDPPSDLPQSIKAMWGDLNEAQREAFQTSHRELSQKVSDASRIASGVKPVQDVLVRAINEFPSLKDMKPEQAAQTIFDSARTFQNLAERPVEVIMGVVKERGLESQLAQALTGQVPQGSQEVSALKNEIASLKQQLQRTSDPEYINQSVSHAIAQERTKETIDRFASEAEHWSAVEAHMPMAIQLVQAKMGEGAASDAVLKSAYELAVSQFVPEAGKAQVEAAEQAAPAPDPEKAEAARKAKSVNVTSTPSSKAKPKTAHEAMEEAWSRIHAN